MAGSYIEGSSKTLSGVYTLIKAVVNSVSIGNRGTVAYPFTSNWGPVGELKTIITPGGFEATFNPVEDTGDALTADLIYEHGFNGQPQKMLCYRMADSNAAKGSVTLDDDSSSESITMETKYPSARSFEAVVKDDPNSSGKIIEIIEGTTKLAEVKGETVSELETALNNTDYVSVTSTGTSLPVNTAGDSFTGGDNGAAVTSTEYSNFLDALEADGTANAFSLDGVTDSAIWDTVEDWVTRVHPDGFYITYVNGGPSSWDSTPSNANDKSTSFNQRYIVNVGNGVDGYTAAEMAIFIAARVASVPLNQSITDEITDYDDVNHTLLPGERVVAKESGTIVFTYSEGGSVIIDEGVNTLTDPRSDEHESMGKIRVNNALDQIAKDLESFGNEYKNGKSNTQEARQTYASLVEDTYFSAMAAMNVIKDTDEFPYSYKVDPDYHGPDAVYNPDLDEAYFLANFTPVDSMEKIYQKFQVQF